MLQFGLPRLQFEGELLRLLQQVLGSHRGFDRIQHDANRLGELFEEGQVGRREGFQRRQLDHGLGVTLEQHRQHDDVRGSGRAEARMHACVVLRHAGQQNTLFFQRALPDQPLAELDSRRLLPVRRVPSQQLKPGRPHRRAGHGTLHLIDRALLCVDQGRQFREKYFTDRHEVALPLKHAGESRQVRLEPVLLLVSLGRGAQVVDHRIDIVFQVGDLAARLDLNGSGQVAPGHRGRDLGNGADLCREVGRQQVDVAREVLPGAGRSRHVGLAAQASFDADLARDAGHLFREDRERVGHVVDGFGQRRHLTFGHARELLAQIPVGNGRDDLHDATHLVGQVCGHEVHRVGEVLPGARHTGHDRLATQPAFGAHLARYARDLRRKRAQLIDHRVDGVLQLENLAFDVDHDLARQVATRNRRRDLRDVPHLRGQVRAHRVDRVGEILPRPGHSGHDRLHAKTALGADLARDARDFRRKRPELFDHRVDGFFQLQDFAADIDRDLARQVAVGDRDGHVGDVAHLTRQVRGHAIHVVGEVLPRARHADHDGLAPEVAFGAHFARHTRHFGRKCVELIDHRVDGVLQLENLPLGVDRDLA